MDPRMRKTIEEEAKEGYRHLLSETEAFLDRNGLTSFGAGISGIGLDKRTLAKRVLGFIYEQNCKEDYHMLEEDLSSTMESVY